MKCKHCGQLIEQTLSKAYFIHIRKSPKALKFCLNESGDFYKKINNKICIAEP